MSNPEVLIDRELAYPVFVIFCGQVTGCSAVSRSYSGASEEGDTLSPDTRASFPTRVARFQDAFWRFLRPHTIRGTIIGTTAVVVRALIDNSHLIDWGLLPKALRGLLALLCGNGYIVGINQIYDIGIDKVNKPFLPVAAGDLSIPAAWALVLSLALLGVIIVATNFGPLIMGLYSFGLFLGAIYSVPPLRLKRFAVAAFLIIATVRGFLLNFGVYYATRASLGLAYTWSPPILFITSFVTIFATVIAITKDLADVEGDRKFQISTFATKLGVRNIAFLGSGLLLMNYLGAIVAACILPEVFRKGFMVVSHSLLSAALIYQTWLLDASKYSKEAIAVYYRFIWNLFYAEGSCNSLSPTQFCELNNTKIIYLPIFNKWVR
ncbi:hypothetical protein GOP47_0008159 [Adiantum capillus-veneris]|uniref:Uncharacterized protein n=1 Tax=Adiantum capillus-veneris TaxID=13818 RepID=A0A9D4UY73_ADICA|nr:hypothetical protein GOP47_0008159 [Adiantum capillus-veneris]